MSAKNSKTNPPDTALIARLTDDRAQKYFGRGFVLRAEVLAAIHTGDRSLYSIAKEYGVSCQAVSKIAQRARAIYGYTIAG
jgi:hypothetical protein